MNLSKHSAWVGLTTRLIALLVILTATGASANWSREPGSETTEPYRTWQMPGTSIASPGGFGANWGQFYFGVGYQSEARNSTTSDASMGIGMGLGNASKYVGVDLSLGLFDISNFKNGAVSLKVHRALPKGFGVAVGREALLGFGDTQTFAGTTMAGIDPRDPAFYATVSKIFFMREETQWFSALTLTGGIGNGRFRSVDDRNADNSTIGFFASAAVRVKQPIALIADWSGQSLNVGASITPIRTLPLFINPVLADVAGISGQSARFVLGAGVAFSFI